MTDRPATGAQARSRVIRRAAQTGMLALLAVVCRASFGGTPLDAATTPGRPRVIRDVPFGTDPRERFDVYLADGVKDAPVIFMVHGGGWSRGAKRAPGVASDKAAHWVPRGFVVISTNYRMLPDTKPVDQARDVARAIAEAQRRAASWGADPSKFILMGHSAGGHLVDLLATSSSAREGVTLVPWIGVVSLDAGAIDVAAIMRGRHARLFDDAFGRDTAYWREASPYDALAAAGAPMLLVCSSLRRASCADNERFAAKAGPLGTRAQLLPEPLSHAQIDHLVGTDSGYTARIDAFLRTLDPAVAARLGGQ